MGTNSVDPQKERVFLALLAGLFAVWTLAYAQSMFVRISSEAVLQFFAAGVSVVTPFLILLWNSVLLGLLALFSPNLNHWKPEPWLKRCIIFFSLIHVATYLWVSRHFELDLVRLWIVASDKILTTNLVIHSHLFKASISLVFDLLNISAPHQLMDSGYALRYLVPTWLAALGLVLYLAVFFLSVVVVFKKRREYPARYRPAALFVLVLVLFATNKVMLNGGPLTYEFITLFPFLWVLLGDLSGDLKANVLQYVRVFIVVLLLASPFLFLVFSGVPVLTAKFTLFGLGAICSVLFWFCLVQACFEFRLSYLLRAIPTGCLLLYVVLTLGWIDDFKYFNAVLPKGLTLRQLSLYPQHELDEPILYQEGALKIHEYENPRRRRVYEVYQAQGIRLRSGYLFGEQPACRTDSWRKVSGSIRLLEPATPNLSGSSPVFDNFSLHECASKRDCDFRFEGTRKSCLPRPSFVLLVNHLYELGVRKSVILIDPKEYQPE